MKIIKLIAILAIAYFLFFRKEGYHYIDLPKVCSKTDPGLKCKNRVGRNIDLTSTSAKDCLTGKDAEVSCKQDTGIYTGGKSKLTGDESNKILDQLNAQVQSDSQQPQIEKGDLSCDTLNPMYVCMIRGKSQIVTPQNAKDCGIDIQCKNKAGTYTKLSKIERDKILDQLKAQIQSEIQQPQIEKGDLSCDTLNPMYVCMIRGKSQIVTPQNAKDCGADIQCKNKDGTYTKLSKIERDKILDQIKSQVQSEIQQPQIEKGDLSCDTLNPMYGCMIRGINTMITPQNAKDCGAEVICKNKAGTYTKLSKVERDNIIDQFKSNIQLGIKQPVNEEISKKANRCSIIRPEIRKINGQLFCKNDLPESYFIPMPKQSSTSPSNYIRLSEL